MRIAKLTPSTIESSWLDFLRWISAMLVVAHHLRTGLFVDAAQLSSHSWVLKLFYFLTLFGRAPVMIFFVLSGYLVGGAALRMGCSIIKLRQYAFDRITRLYIVLIPGFILILLSFKLLNLIGIPSIPLDSVSMKTLLGNLLFLQMISVGCFGGDFPLWSLTNEFWYYLMFPMILIVLFAKESTNLRYLAALGLFSIIIFVPKGILIYFLHWLVGASVNLIRKPPRISFLISFLALGILMIISRLFFAGGDFLLDLLLACATALTILTSRNLSIASPFFYRTAPIWRLLAGFSFSLYILHVPILYIYKFGILHLEHRLQPTTQGFLNYLVVFASVVIGSLIFALLTEFQTRRLRQFFHKRIFFPHSP